MQIVDQFLRALNGKRRNDNLAFFVDGAAHHFAQFFHSDFRTFVAAVTVGAFYKNVVGRGYVGGGVANNRLFFAPQVARKQNADFIVTQTAVCAAPPLRASVHRLFFGRCLTAVLFYAPFCRFCVNAFCLGKRAFFCHGIHPGVHTVPQGAAALFKLLRRFVNFSALSFNRYVGKG